jgi:hypothetical protein
MIRYALACDEGHTFEMVCELGDLRPSGQARARQLSGLQFD